MKLSILLPTRNGAGYLRDCLRAVLAQPSEDFELVVSDNANTDETPAILAEYAGDSRLRVVRTDVVLPVTANWKQALEASTGEYVLMLGDDDLLLAGSVDRLLALVDGPSPPDCVTYNAYSYVFPDAIAGLTTSRYSPRHFTFDDTFVSGTLLSRQQRRSIVLDMFRFRPRVPLNMQTTLFCRHLADQVPGGPFQEPFPDHFAINAMLLLADRWLFVDERLLVVGVSPKSFGHFVYSSDSDAGLAYLGIDSRFEGWLPGNELLSSMYIWLELLRRTFPEQLREVEVSRGDYVARQVWSLERQRRLGRLTWREMAAALRHLSPADWLVLARTAADPALVKQGLMRIRRARGDTTQLLWEGLCELEGSVSIADFATSVGSVEGEVST